jgi:hypothetical protein
MDNNKIREAIVDFYRANPHTDLHASDVAKMFNFSLGDPEKTSKCVRDLKRRALGSRKRGKIKVNVKMYNDIKEDFIKGTLESTIVVNFEPKSVGELYKEHKINPDLYVIKNYWSKKQPNGKFTSSVFAVKKTLETAELTDFKKILEDYKSPYQPIDKSQIHINKELTRPTCLFLHLTDFHLDKLDIYGTTLEEKKQQFFDITKKLLYKAYHSNYI